MEWDRSGPLWQGKSYLLVWPVLGEESLLWLCYYRVRADWLWRSDNLQGTFPSSGKPWLRLIYWSMARVLTPCRLFVIPTPSSLKVAGFFNDCKYLPFRVFWWSRKRLVDNSLKSFFKLLWETKFLPRNVLLLIARMCSQRVGKQYSVMVMIETIGGWRRYDKEEEIVREAKTRQKENENGGKCGVVSRSVFVCIKKKLMFLFCFCPFQPNKTHTKCWQTG